jgi:hypothetical protein
MKKMLELKMKLIIPLNGATKGTDARIFPSEWPSTCGSNLSCYCSYLGKVPDEGALNLANEDDCIA